MPYDPDQPAFKAPLASATMRSQLLGLFQLIQSIPAGPPGPQGETGAPGQPFASVVIDSVITVEPSEPASVTATFDGTTVHLVLRIPRGFTGAQGLPGEVTAQQMTDAISAALAGHPTTDQLNSALAAALAGYPTNEQFNAALTAALATAAGNSSANSNAVAPLNLTVSDPPTQSELQQIVSKLDELILALRR